jgi:hypothetical protein
MEQAVQHPTRRPLLAGGGVGLLDLVHDLVFPQHHRIEPAGDAEEMPTRLLARKRVEIGLEVVDRQVARLGNEGQHFLDPRRLFVIAGDEDLHAVACA